MKVGMFCSLLFATTVGLFANEKAKPCTREDAIRADHEASSLRGWAEVYKSYKNFAQCDDGGIAEGYSDSVARLLSEKWASADQLNRLSSRDRGFEKFVLRHIDELMTPDQANKIRDNADTRCPSHAKRLCEKIAARIRDTGP
jgi:hypothetical protein